MEERQRRAEERQERLLQQAQTTRQKGQSGKMGADSGSSTGQRPHTTHGKIHADDKKGRHSHLFEKHNVVQNYSIDKRHWMKHLIPVLNQQVMQAYDRVATNIQDDYDQVKGSILRELK